ncbi:hypothetical protein [Actinoplanes aureus]|uniref:Uncharacterized protein n=1 Tax=Actinoplanes aureus TaxID=2792083 RepID=A0A931C347_9ACTN|nr:hypothetical protein [Actinoplanes aureus]MBG0560241.1 hypothetical protein [Actinoplanes aureus]
MGTGLGDAVEAGAILAETGEIGPRLVGFAAVDDWRLAAFEGEALTWWSAADVAGLLAVIWFGSLQTLPRAGMIPRSCCGVPPGVRRRPNT